MELLEIEFIIEKKRMNYTEAMDYLISDISEIIITESDGLVKKQYTIAI